MLLYQSLLGFVKQFNANSDNMLNMEVFAERLKELRTEKGLSQIELAKETGLSQTAITYWETQQRIPSAQAVVILAKYFEVSTDYLLGMID